MVLSQWMGLSPADGSGRRTGLVCAVLALGLMAAPVVAQDEVTAPVPMPALNYYQLWHDLTHRSAASRWLREQVRDVVRGLHQVQPPVRHH